MERNNGRGLTIGKYASTINAWLNDNSISTLVSNKNASGKIIQHKRGFFFKLMVRFQKKTTIDFVHTRPNLVSTSFYGWSSEKNKNPLYNTARRSKVSDCVDWCLEVTAQKQMLTNQVNYFTVFIRRLTLRKPTYSLKCNQKSGTKPKIVFK